MRNTSYVTPGQYIHRYVSHYETYTYCRQCTLIFLILLYFIFVWFLFCGTLGELSETTTLISQIDSEWLTVWKNLLQCEQQLGLIHLLIIPSNNGNFPVTYSIYWVLSMCHALAYVLGIQQLKKKLPHNS